MRRGNCVSWVASVGLVATTFATGLGAEIADPRRPAAVAVEGVPVVPAELFARMAQYTNVRAASFGGWAPDGTGVLVRTRFGNTAQLHRVYVPGGRREQITFYDDPVDGRFIQQANDGAKNGDGAERLLLAMSRGGSENDQFYVLDRKQFRTTLLTDGKSRHLGGPMLEDGSKTIVGSNRRNGRDTDLYILDLTGGAQNASDTMQLLLQADRQHWQAADWSRDGRTVLLKRYVSANESYLATLDVASGRRADLSLPGAGKEPHAIGALAFSPDAKSIYLATDVQSEFLRLARFEPATNRWEWLSDDLAWDVSELEVDSGTGRLAFTVNEDGATRLFLLDGGRRREMKLPLGLAASLKFSPDGKQLGFTLARPDAPADVYSLTLDNGELTRWTFSETGGLNPASFVLPQRVRFPSFDGREIPAYVYRPRTASAERKVPVLLTIHGGPESQYRPTFSSSAQFYANELGIAVIAPNVRGSHGYGKTYLKLDNGPKREDSVRDIGALLDWIARQPDLDASRVAVVGASYGGYMVLASLTNFPERIRAGIDIVGIANFLTFLENTASYRQDLRRAEYGDERDPEMRKVFERISPAAHADRIRSALLVAHGKNDPRVPFSEAEQIAAKVRAKGQSVWTVFADNEGHGFAKKDNAEYLTAVEVLFLQKHLLP